jgi:peptidoglycan/xylan/chitin deacetylase (PgdA/CDA1 family)
LLRILTYHRICEYRRYSALTNVSATSEMFAEQVKYLRNNYVVITLEEVLRSLQRKVSLPSRAVLITFDDAYSDFGEVAWPILKHHNLPATLFVPTAFPGNPSLKFWWDRLKAAFMTTTKMKIAVNGTIFPLTTLQLRNRAYFLLSREIERMPYETGMCLVETTCKELREPELKHAAVMSWDDLRRVAQQGATLAAHSRTHPIMTNIPPERMRWEVAGSRDDLRREIGISATAFAYPSGAHNREVVRILQEEGFQLAVTTNKNHNDFAVADPFRLSRTNISPRTPMAIFKLRLLRGFPYIDALRDRLSLRQAA